jgi:hypothetical protein
MNAHEVGLLAFLTEPTRRRVGRLLDLGPKRRAGFRAKLDHEMRFDPDLARPLDGTDATPERIGPADRRGSTRDVSCDFGRPGTGRP